MCEGSKMMPFRKSSNFSFGDCFCATLGFVVSLPKREDGLFFNGFTASYWPGAVSVFDRKRKFWSARI